MSEATTIRPPERICEAIERRRHEGYQKRSTFVVRALDGYLGALESGTAGTPDLGSLYGRLNCKLTQRPIALSVPKHRLRSYRGAAQRLTSGNLTGLVSLAVAHCCDL